MNKYLVRNFKWRENLGKVPAKVYRLVFYDEFGLNHSPGVGNMTFLVKVMPPAPGLLIGHI